MSGEIMKGLDPEAYDLTLDDIAIEIAYARRDKEAPAERLRTRFFISQEQAEDWVGAAFRANRVPDHNLMTRPNDMKNLRRVR